MIVEFLIAAIFNFYSTLEGMVIGWTDGLPYMSTVQDLWVDGLETFAGPLPAVVCGPCLVLLAQTLQFALSYWALNGVYKAYVRLRRLLPT